MFLCVRRKTITLHIIEEGCYEKDVDFQVSLGDPRILGEWDASGRDRQGRGRHFHMKRISLPPSFIFDPRNTHSVSRWMYDETEIQHSAPDMYSLPAGSFVKNKLFISFSADTRS